MESLRGHLLISNGGLFDPNFRHTVVLVGEHNADGALGVVLNRALNVTVQEAVPGLSGLVPAGEPALRGRSSSARRAPCCLPSLSIPNWRTSWCSGPWAFLWARSRRRSGLGLSEHGVFAGYSGWGPGQLEAEMEKDSWILEPARVGDVFTDAPDLLWSQVLERKGPEYRQLSWMPYDPSMN